MLARFRARGDVRRRAACAGRGPQGDVALRAFLRIGGRLKACEGDCLLASPFRG